MNLKWKTILLTLLPILALGLIFFSPQHKTVDNQILSYTVDPKKNEMKFYWKNENGEILNSIQNLKSFVEAKK